MKINWNTANRLDIHPEKEFQWGRCNIDEHQVMTLSYEDEVKKVRIKRNFLARETTKNLHKTLRIVSGLLIKLDMHHRGNISKKLKEEEFLNIFPANPSNWDFEIDYKKEEK